MKRHFKILAVVLIATLAACGGDGGEKHSLLTTANASVQSGSGGFVIQMFGDSTTAGAQTMNGRLYQTAANEPALVQTFLRQWFNRLDIAVDNQGVGGTEAAQLLNGTDGVHPPFDQMMAASAARVVVFNFGLNDSYYAQPQITPPPGAPRETVADYWSYMVQLCQIARNHGKICVFQEPNSVNGVQDPNAPIYGYVYNLRLLTQQINAPLVAQFDASRALPGWLGWLSEDGTHPRDELYAWKANNTASVLIGVIAPML